MFVTGQVQVWLNATQPSPPSAETVPGVEPDSSDDNRIVLPPVPTKQSIYQHKKKMSVSSISTDGESMNTDHKQSVEIN